MINRLSLILALTMFQFAAYTQQVFKLDLNKSKILWKSPKTMGNSRHFGYLHFNSGQLTYSLAGKPISGVFSLNMNSIRSTEHAQAAKNQKIEQEIKSTDFFAVSQYPTATMQVKKIVPTGRPTIFNVVGDLTIKGITNHIEFTAEIKKSGSIILISGDLKIDRIKWNIHHIPNPNSSDFFQVLKDKVIADEIPISLQLMFNKANP